MHFDLAFGRLRQEGEDSKTTMGYIVRSQPGVGETLSQNTKINSLLVKWESWFNG